MKLKLLFGIIVATSWFGGLYADPAAKASKSHPPLPPLPPGLVYAEGGKVVADTNFEKARKAAKEAAIAANNPAPGSEINEPAGAELPKKKSTGGDATSSPIPE